ncbi:MAG TPA: hypothetical protein VF686_04115 [Brevundimonas sp.]|jgi:hypothetical protein
MTVPPLIILALIAVGVAIVVWFVRRKPDTPGTGPRDADTAWNDPVTPTPTTADPVRRNDTLSDAPPPSRDPLP